MTYCIELKIHKIWDRDHYLKERELRIFLQKQVYNSVPHGTWKTELENANPGLVVIFDFMEKHIK